MSFVQDLISPGARQAGDAAETSAEAQKMLAERMIKFQDMLLGEVNKAKSQGLFDPNVLMEQYAKAFDSAHSQDLGIVDSGLARSGLKPGDSEYSYNSDKARNMLLKEKSQGMANAGQEALMKELSAYAATSPELSASAASLFNSAGNMGIQAGQIAGQGQQQMYNNIAGIYGGLSKFFNPKKKQQGFDPGAFDYLM